MPTGLRGALGAGEPEARLVFLHKGAAIFRVIEGEDTRTRAVTVSLDTLTAWDGAVLVGAMYVVYLPSTVREERCYVFGAVHPDHRGRGIGRCLLEAGLERSAFVLQSSGNNLPKYIRVDSSRTNKSAIRLFERFALEPIRYFADLRADLRQSTPAARPWRSATRSALPRLRARSPPHVALRRSRGRSVRAPMQVPRRSALRQIARCAYRSEGRDASGKSVLET